MDVDNANCKVKVSQCTDMEALTIDRPIKIDREITGLEILVEELHRVFSNDHVNVQDVQKLMAGYKSDPKDWRKYAKFDRFRYTRNLVDAGNGAFNIMIICWGAGHASAIHDHADSHCFMKILSGSLEEVRYDWPENVQPEVRKVLKTSTKPVRRCCSESEDFDSICPNGGCQNETTNGESENDRCQNGGAENGRVENGGTENGGYENGRVENGGIENGGYENGGYENGGTENSGTENGGYENGRVENGGTENGGYENGKVENGGYENGGYENEVDHAMASEMEEISRTRLEVNDVCYINDALGLHRMENPSHVDSAISLHLYSPPFDSCRVFDARTGKPTSVTVTFTSMYGKKVKRVLNANHVADSQ